MGIVELYVVGVLSAVGLCAFLTASVSRRQLQFIALLESVTKLVLESVAKTSSHSEWKMYASLVVNK